MTDGLSGALLNRIEDRGGRKASSRPVLRGAARRARGGIGLAMAALLAVGVGPVSSLAADVPPITLRTADQLDAEAMALRVLSHPKVRRAQAEVHEALLADRSAQTAEGRAQIDYTLSLWTGTVALQHARSDLADPAFIWYENTPHDWFGFTSPASGIEGENTDNVYRIAYIDGAHRYEIRGRVPPNGPSQFSFDVEHGQPGKVLLLDKLKKGEVDPGIQIGMLPDSLIDVDAQGNFVIGLGPTPGPKRNYIQTAPGSLSILYRNTLSDWRQSPTTISIRPLDPMQPKPALTEDEIAARVAADLKPWVLKWVSMKDVGLSVSSPINTAPTPMSRHGNWWGVITGGRYRLADDEALVATIATGGAKYTGVQIANRWFMDPSAVETFGSRSLAQAKPNTDGTYTYVISPVDPGAFNWLSTAGSHEGYVAIRWQQMSEKTDSKTLVRSIKVVKLSDLKRELPQETVWLTPEQRAQDLAERARQFKSRYQN